MQIRKLHFVKSMFCKQCRHGRGLSAKKPRGGRLVDGTARFGGRPKELLAGEFLGDAIGVVDLQQGFHDSVDVHRDGARNVVLEHEVVVQ